MGSVTMRGFIVLRNCPPGAESLEGRWYEVARAMIYAGQLSGGEGAVTFGRTRRYETREDGERAEVFEPCEKD